MECFTNNPDLGGFSIEGELYFAAAPELRSGLDSRGRLSLHDRLLYSVAVDGGVLTRFRSACRMSDPLMPKQTTAPKATTSSMLRFIRRLSANNDAMAQMMPRTLSQRGECMFGRSWRKRTWSSSAAKPIADTTTNATGLKKALGS